jgi:hypothetical protein
VPGSGQFEFRISDIPAADALQPTEGTPSPMISCIGDPSLRLKCGSARDDATLDCHEIQTEPLTNAGLR